ncbi:chorismate mutase domain of P-protein [Rhodococcus phage Trina]|uniref:Chorismate mutase domain of P-protein n=1 Tax=Rhodococcus phage Trina TaxID=2027905 RepID=A0A2D1AE59_9CAUD|nr:chorismate mutase domain of P-protein [Rhodococcus phage Trina]ASZ74977.1 chorismate mutase domain of P-protein [Rhodococcus phage Trina]
MVNEEKNLLNTPYGRAILVGLQKKLMYYGTVPAATIAKRRAANKVARNQRKVNRQNGSGR